MYNNHIICHLMSLITASYQEHLSTLTPISDNQWFPVLKEHFMNPNDCCGADQPISVENTSATGSLCARGRLADSLPTSNRPSTQKAICLSCRRHCSDKCQSPSTGYIHSHRAAAKITAPSALAYTKPWEAHELSSASIAHLVVCVSHPFLLHRRSSAKAY